MDLTDAFESERPRLPALAGRALAHHAEAEDVVQLARMSLHATGTRGTDVASLPAWLTTVNTRLCLDRLSPPERVVFVCKGDIEGTGAAPTARGVDDREGST